MMKRRISFPIFAQILLATLLPLIVIFSVVIVTVTKSTFNANIEMAQEKSLALARQSAEQVRSSLISASRLMKLAAHGLAPIAGDSDQAREAALGFVEKIFQDAPNVILIRLYFEPGEDTFRQDDSFAYELYLENGVVVRRFLSMENETGPDLSLPQYAVPLNEGVPYHHSIATLEPIGPVESPAYIASTNYPVIRDGKVIGCVGMDMLYRRSFPLIDEREEEGSYRFLIRQGGTILYAAEAGLIGRNIDSLGFDSDLLADIENAMLQDRFFMGEGDSPVSGKKSLICVYPLGLSPTLSRIFLYIGTPTEIVYRGAMDSTRTMFLAFLIGLLLFAGSLFAVTRNIVGPIERLTESADQIANGQFEVSLEEFDDKTITMSEIFSLERSLQKMFKQLVNNHKLKIIAVEAEHEKMKLENAAAVKDRFFANMSHEIRTPMNVILGVSEILLTENLTNDQKRFVQDIKVSSEGLLGIINDILDLSRLESGELSLLPVHYDFHVLVENVCSLSAYLAGKKGLDFRVETITDMPEFFYGDDGRLRQVLLNVIGNAIKFTQTGSVTMTITDEGETLRFDICDTGIGIQVEDRQFLFKPFKRIDGPETRHAKGTGLGLSICLNLIELMNGTITVDSEYSKGTTFHITIPKVLGDGNQVEIKVAALPLSFDPGSRIMVVDDSESNLKVAREFLKMFGITAETASSGAEAVTMVANSEYDLIFMDHMMPEMDGVETTHRIRALGDRQAKMPIVALTANAVIGSRELLLASGINDFLAKPIEKIKFQAILAKWLPENLVIRQKSTPDSQISLASTQLTSIRAKTGGIEGESKGSRIMSILASVSEIKDLDIPLGLSRLAGNMKLYVELLGLIVEMIPEALKKIDEALADGFLAGLALEIHTLKGSLANLGAVELANRAAELEQLDSQGDFDAFVEKLRVFRVALMEFVSKLRESLSTGEKEARLIVSGDQPCLEDTLRELRASLADFEHEKSIEIITRLARFDWGEICNLGIKNVWTHIKHFDYDAAMSELHQNFPETELPHRPFVA